jgi:putative ABC transport system permease protein
MFPSLFRQSIRRLLRQRLFTLIHILGFALGLASTGLIALYVHEELTFDREHVNLNRITRVLTIRPGGTGEMQHLPFAVATLGPALKERIPEVEASARLMAMFNWIITDGDQRQQVDAMLAADPDYFKIMTVDVLEGDPVVALSSPDKVVITRRIADMFFDDGPALGRTLTFDDNRELTVGAVLADPGELAHMPIDVYVPYQLFVGDPDWAWLDSWYTSTITYVLLHDGVDPVSLKPRLEPLIRELLPDQGGISMELQPMRDIHLHSSHVMYDYAPHRSEMSRVVLFVVIGAGILLLAVVNFMNLATSRSLTRAREVGLRKVVGATRPSLVRQFLIEAVTLALIAVPVALLLMELALPWLRTLAERPLENMFIHSPAAVLLLTAVALLTGLLAGSYPSLVLSAFRPVNMLRGQMSTGREGVRLRRGLVLVQLVGSILLLMTAATIYRQIHYLKNRPLGYYVDHMVILPVSGDITGGDFLAMRNDVISDPGVITATLSEVVPGVTTAEDNVIPEGWQGDPITVDKNIVCETFVETMGLTLVDGRNFDPARPADLMSCLVNETAIEAFGWDDWRGHKIRGASGRDFPVIGVVKDYHFKSLHTPVSPQFIIYYPPRGAYMTVRVHAHGLNDTVDRLGDIWQKHIPERPYEYHFLDEQVGRWYRAEERTGTLIGLFSGLALLISGLGLLGLAAFAAERRRFEIGVRKVLGAGRARVLGLILREFVVLALAANVISWVISMQLERSWAAQFVDRVPVSWWVLPAATGATMLMVLLVTGALAWRAASVNPVEVLRSE